MRDQAVGQPDVRSLALAEPTQHVRYRWIVGLTLASLGMWMATQTPLQVMLAVQLQDITPRHKVVALGVVTGIGAISSALATPVVGALSDRTAHGGRQGRFSGRRHPWTLVMVVLAAACMVLLAKQATVLGVALLWLLFSAFQNGEFASLSAAIPDHVPVRQRATVSGWVGMPIALGLVLGSILFVDVLDQDLVTGYVILAVLMALLALPFVLFTPDPPLSPEDREPFSWRQVASSYWISPREYPDFGWAWLTRFLASLSIAMGTLYLLYFLRDAVHYPRLLHRGRLGADHAGAAEGPGPGQGPRHHQHRHRVPGRHRRGHRGAPRLAGRLSGPVRRDRGGSRRGLDRGLADQERPLSARAGLRASRAYRGGRPSGGRMGRLGGTGGRRGPDHMAGTA